MVKNYIGKDIDFLFAQDDYKERATETQIMSLINTHVQTDIEDLCGESVGVKKRKNNNPYHSSFSMRQNKPMFFPDHRPYNQRVLANEAHNLNINPNSPELKRKHLRVRRLLSTIKEVIFQ